jgi:hypothetical protein
LQHAAFFVFIQPAVKHSAAVCEHPVTQGMRRTMKAYFVGVLGVALAIGASSVLAQSYERYDSRYSSAMGDSADQPYYDYARVIRVDPVLERG